MTSDGELQVRAYAEGDAETTFAVFLDAVQITASADYSVEQTAAWARPDRRDLDEWDRRRRSTGTIVALFEGAVAGFSDVDATGLIDMMFVAPAYARRGVATALMDEIVVRARALGIGTLRADVSLTARPFFERAGFRVVREQHPIVDGIEMTNFRMERILQATRRPVRVLGEPGAHEVAIEQVAVDSCPASRS